MTIQEVEELDNDVLVEYMCEAYYMKKQMTHVMNLEGASNAAKDLDNFRYVLFHRLGGTRYDKLKAVSDFDELREYNKRHCGQPQKEAHVEN